MVVPQIDRIWVQYGRQFDELVSYGRLETWIDRHVCGWIPSKPQVFLWEEYVELADGSPDAKRGYNRIQARLSGQDVLSCVLKSCLHANVRMCYVFLGNGAAWAWCLDGCPPVASFGKPLAWT